MASLFPYYLPDEVVLHNKPDDCWLSCFGNVHDLTDYARINFSSPIVRFLVAHAGKDVSHWFDPRGRRDGLARLRRYVDPATGLPQILLPFSNPLPEGVESSMRPICDKCCLAKSWEWNRMNHADLTGKCWLDLEYIFNEPEYRRGLLTKKSRPCRITNVLTGQKAIISVCEEDTIDRIRERFLLFNSQAKSYTWKFEGKPLDMSLTLTENGIPDDRDRYLTDDSAGAYVPNLLCYYNDDLTEM